jgi:hypothetical protein
MPDSNSECRWDIRTALGTAGASALTTIFLLANGQRGPAVAMGLVSAGLTILGLAGVHAAKTSSTPQNARRNALVPLAPGQQ